MVLLLSVILSGALRLSRVRGIAQGKTPRIMRMTQIRAPANYCKAAACLWRPSSSSTIRLICL